MSNNQLDGWVCIFSSDFVPKLELFKSLLHNQGIHSIVHNQKDSSYGFGEAHLFVRAENVIKAKHIIKDDSE